jgi:WD40 repeat protein
MRQTTVTYNPKSISPTQVVKKEFNATYNIQNNSKQVESIQFDDLVFYPDQYRQIDFLSNRPENVTDYENNQKFCQDKYKGTKKFDDYPLFRRALIDGMYTSKPCRDSRYASQGVCQIGNTTFITSYDTAFTKTAIPWETDDKRRSILDIIDDKGRHKRLRFDNEAHVGGISYNSHYEKIYVSGPDGTVNIYDMDDVASLENGDTLDKHINIKVDHAASYLTVDNDSLLVGEFTEDGPGTLTFYDITDKGNNLKYSKQIEVPFEKAQGVCTIEKNGEKFYVFSCSYGRQSDSKLIVARLNGDEFEKVRSITLPCMSEQVSVDKDGNLMVVFESDCKKYGYQAYRSTTLIGNVVHLDSDELIRERDLPLDGWFNPPGEEKGNTTQI